MVGTRKNMMKNYFKKLFLLSVLLLGFSVTSCGKVVQDDPGSNNGGGDQGTVTIDKSKKQIYISLYNGGHGTSWLGDIIRNFNEEVAYDQGYEAVLLAEKKSLSVIAAELSSNQTQVYLTADSNFISSIYEGHLADLSDIMNADVDNNGKTISDKMSNPDEWEAVYSRDGEGVYTLPWADAIVGLVYDHDTFIHNNWYFFADSSDESDMSTQGITFTKNNGRYYFESSTGSTNYEKDDVILSPGKDGQFGTYDDGQPTTTTEWETMVRKIYNSDVYPFMWSGYADVYVNHLFTALLAQYGGIDDYQVYNTFDSNGEEITLSDGTNKVIDIKTNGYLVNEMESLYKAYKFVYDYMGKSNPDAKDNLHPYSTTNSVSHNDVQKTFLLGNAGYLLGSGTSKQSALLVDGVWWEYEARTIYSNLGSGYNYGDREFRYLLLPALDGQEMAADQTVFASGESGTILVPQDEDEDRLAMSKEFVKYVLKDENLQYFTKVTGATTAYNYTLSDEFIAELTPFARNTFELVSDHEHITIVRPNITELTSPLSFASNLGIDFKYRTRIDGVQTRTIWALREYSLNKIWEGSEKLYTKSQWESFINQAENAGFLD